MVLCGGRSAEHEISLLSGKNIFASLDKSKYLPELLVIEKDGNIEPFLKSCFSKKIDVIFPILHGPMGEDGTIQGLLKLLHLPFVGASVLGSAIGMDKDVMKRLLRDAKIPIPKFLVINEKNLTSLTLKEVESKIGFPFFTKPANLGSSVGIFKVKDPHNWKEIVQESFLYDRKVLLEEYIVARELECSVLGNANPIASLPGELVPGDEFYSYQAKYTDMGTHFYIPAELDLKIIDRIQKLAIQTYKALSCEGMGRVDFFLTEKNEIYVNEINTLPGFTGTSMYPKLWEVSGLTISKLLDRLIELAIERFRKESRLQTTFSCINEPGFLSKK